MGEVADSEVAAARNENPMASVFVLYSKVALKFALVCKDWLPLAFGPQANPFWHELVVRFRWPELRKLSLKVKNWYTFTKSRIQAQRAILEHPRAEVVDVSLADNCHKLILDEDETEWQLKCPKIFDTMEPTNDDNVKFCSGCSTNVYLVKDIEEMNTHTKQGHCIAFYTSRRYEMQAKLSHKGILGIDAIWKSKEEYDESGPSVVGRRCF